MRVQLQLTHRRMIILTQLNKVKIARWMEMKTVLLMRVVKEVKKKTIAVFSFTFKSKIRALKISSIQSAVFKFSSQF